MRENSKQPGQAPVGRWSDVSGAGSAVTWGVGAVADRLGVAASTLRTWERRYGIGPSHRTGGGHRRYTERDINRVEVVRRLVARGVSAQDAARVAVELDHEDLARVLSEERSDGPGPQDIVDSVLAAVIAGDESRLHEIVVELLDGVPALDVWREVLAPAFTRMAHEVTTSAFHPEALVWASSLVRQRLLERRIAPDQGAGARVLLVTVGPTDSLVLAVLALVLAQTVTLHVVEAEGPGQVAEVVEQDQPWSVLVVWDPVDLAAASIREGHGPSGDVAMVGVRPGWPHEAWLRLGTDRTEIAADVGAVVAHVLDQLR